MVFIWAFSPGQLLKGWRMNERQICLQNFHQPRYDIKDSGKKALFKHPLKCVISQKNNFEFSNKIEIHEKWYKKRIQRLGLILL